MKKNILIILNLELIKKKLELKKYMVSIFFLTANNVNIKLIVFSSTLALKNKSTKFCK